MPATSAIAKKSTAGTNKNVADVTPTRISSRVRKEKFNVKDLFSQKEVYADSEESIKRTPKRKLPDSPKSIVVSKESAKDHLSAVIQKFIPVKAHSSVKIISKRLNDDSLPGPSRIYETPTTYKVVKVTRIPTQKSKANLVSEKSKSSQSSNEETRLAGCIFTENNIDSVLENPSALGLDIVVTRLSESESKTSGNDKSKNNQVTISKLGDDPKTEPIKIVPTKLNKKDDRPKIKEPEIIPESLPKGLSITPQVKRPEPSSVRKTPSTLPSDFDSRLEQELENILNDSATVLKRVDEKKEEQSQPNGRREVDKKKRKDVNGVQPGNDSFTKKNKMDQDFMRYFIISRTLVEHNDSLDSESENEEPVLSHFLPPHILQKSEPTIYDLVAEVSLDKPSWNLHIMQDTGSYLLAHVARGPNGLPIMNKIIELDQQFAAKVYVNQIYQRQFTGVYDSYDSIRELITSVDHL